MNNHGHNIPPEDLARINHLALDPLQPEDLLTRSMYLCSDQLCTTDWGRFTREALEQIAEKLPGESLLCGHNKQSLPIGRFYKAEVVTRSAPGSETAAHWVRAWFYWLRGTEGAQDLARNIDGGIYREVSISWRFRHGACSICRENIRACPHTPGRTYNGRLCTFDIDQVEDVLEGSIVYRAADRHAVFEGNERGEGEGIDVRIPALCHALRGIMPLPAHVDSPATPAWLPAVLRRLGFTVDELDEGARAAIPLVVTDLSPVSGRELGREVRRLADLLPPHVQLVACYGPDQAGAEDRGDGNLAEALLEAGLVVEAEYQRSLPHGPWELVRARKEN